MCSIIQSQAPHSPYIPRINRCQQLLHIQNLLLVDSRRTREDVAFNKLCLGSFSCIGYASWEDGIPVVHLIIGRNETDEPLYIPQH